MRSARSLCTSLGTRVPLHQSRRASRIARTVAVLTVLAGTLPPTSAQPLLETRDELSFNRPESWAMKYFASLTLPTGFGAPRADDPGSVELLLEGGSVPSLSEAERRVGFNGTKVEDINRTSVVGRLGATFALPAAFSLGVSWMPPLELDGVEANLLGLSLGRPVWDRDPWRVGLRLLGQAGTIEGDITCSRADVAGGDDPALNPFRCEEPSSDEMEIRSLGVELSASVQVGRDGSFEPFGSFAVVAHDLEFQIDAVHSGILDRTLLLTDGNTTAFTVGVNYFPADRWRLAGEIFYAPLDVNRPLASGSESDDLWNLRILGSYRIR